MHFESTAKITHEVIWGYAVDAAVQITGIHFRPPLAFARLGGAASPMDNYVWREDPTLHGSARTVVDPALTLEVLADGSVLPVMPSVIRFRQDGKLRPVAPFFELWATVTYGEGAEGPAGTSATVPLTATLLSRAGGRLSAVIYRVAVTNRKAARRTGDDGDSFGATAEARGDDFAPKTLRAASPARSGGTSLVFPDRPIPLGSFQVIRPVAVPDSAVELDTLRIRFTPAAGEVYGPPTAVRGDDPRTGRSYEMVPEANRVLNPASRWLQHRLGDTDPQPSDTYDGAEQESNQSWGVVDDTCDGTVAVTMVVGKRVLSATARVCVGPPDYAPDRRPFLSLADDLADRDLDMVEVDEATQASTQRRIADLFSRVWETAALTNVDAIRARAIRDNSQQQGEAQTRPLTDRDTMRYPKDLPYVSQNVAAFAGVAFDADDLVFTRFVQLAHARLTDEDTLVEFFARHPDRVRAMVRPPYGHFAELEASVQRGQDPAPDHRDPRIIRDQMHDMRMPPYMRDELASALGLTRRQYADLISYLDLVERANEPTQGLGPELAAAAPAPELSTPLRRRIQQRLQVLGMSAP